MNLIYMAKPTYGGWVSFTTHLSLKTDSKICKIGKRTEIRKNKEPILRKYGYGLKYQNFHIDDAILLPNIIITAIDKHFYKYIHRFPDNTCIVIHDPTEITGKKAKILLDNLPRFRVITIRKIIHKLLKNEHNIDNIFLHHPFYEFPKKNINKTNKSIAISRIDFDKYTHTIVMANNKLPKKKRIEIYGKKNDLYVYHGIKNKMNLETEFERDYKGSFGKSFEELNSLLGDKKFVVDLSAIKNDGGGSQYTFLEAIYNDCILILNSAWITNTNSIFKQNFNCIVVSNLDDLHHFILNENINSDRILKNSKKILEPHVTVNWNKLF